MKVFLLVALLALLATSGYCGMKAVFVVSANGARAPNVQENALYPNNSWNYLDAISPAGSRQAYLLGNELRRRYLINPSASNNILPLNFDPNTLYGESQDVNASISTLTAIFEGLYPAGTGPILSSSISSSLYNPPGVATLHANAANLGLSAADSMQPEMISVFDANSDVWTNGAQVNTCPGVQSLINNFYKSTQYSNIDSAFGSVKANAQAATMYSNPNYTIPNLALLYSKLTLDQYGGFNTPFDPNANNTSPYLFAYNLNLFGTRFNSDDAANWLMSPLMQDVTATFDGVINAAYPNGMSVYTTDNVAIAGLMKYFGITSAQCLFDRYSNPVNYNSYNCPLLQEGVPNNFVFELTDLGQNQTYVRTLFNDRVYVPCSGNDVVNQQYCTYSAFKNWVTGKASSNYDNRCGRPVNAPVPQLQPTPPDVSVRYLLTLIALVAFSIELILFTVYVVLKSRDYTKVVS